MIGASASMAPIVSPWLSALSAWQGFESFGCIVQKGHEFFSPSGGYWFVMELMGAAQPGDVSVGRGRGHRQG